MFALSWSAFRHYRNRKHLRTAKQAQARLAELEEQQDWKTAMNFARQAAVRYPQADFGTRIAIFSEKLEYTRAQQARARNGE